MTHEVFSTDLVNIGAIKPQALNAFSAKLEDIDKPIPDGVYEANVIAYYFGKSKVKKTPYLKMEFNLKEHQREVFRYWYIPEALKCGNLRIERELKQNKEKAIKRLASELYNTFRITGRLDRRTLDKLIGKPCKVRIINHPEYGAQVRWTYK